jgi:sarcosine oxidase gamma subunit
MGSYIISMARRFCMMGTPEEWLVRAGEEPDLSALRRALVKATSSCTVSEQSAHLEQ